MIVFSVISGTTKSDRSDIKGVKLMQGGQYNDISIIVRFIHNSTCDNLLFT